MGHPSHRRGGRAGVSLALVVSVVCAFALGWLAATLLAAMTAAPTSHVATSAAPSPAAPAPAPSAGGSPPSAGAVVPVGFAQPAMTPAGLEVTSVLTKVKGGVDVTLVARNRVDHPVAVDTASLGPHEVTFRGAPVPMQMPQRTKTLVPGEALVYSCRVTLPDMNVGQLSFTVAGVPISGPAAGD
jgi:hypothetical protein